MNQWKSPLTLQNNQISYCNYTKDRYDLFIIGSQSSFPLWFTIQHIARLILLYILIFQTKCELVFNGGAAGYKYIVKMSIKHYFFLSLFLTAINHIYKK